jgi:hypothetical protein
MSFFIFLKTFENSPNPLYRIAENQYDLDNLNIIKSDYKIIEDSQENFNNVKYGTKTIEKYIDNTIVYIDNFFVFENKTYLQLYIKNNQEQIQCFLDNNKNHVQFNRWNDYYTQLKTTDLNNIVFPLNKSLEKYYNDLGQPSLNSLQLP